MDIIPDDSSGAGDSATAKVRKAWNPRGIAWISFFFSVLPASVLHIINWGRLGYPERRKTTAVNLILLSVMFVALIRLMSGFTGEIVVFVVNALYSVYLSRSQRKAYRKLLEEGGQRARLWIPAVLSFLFMLVMTVLVVLVAPLFMTEQQKSHDRVEHLLRTRQYEEARAVCLDVIDRDSTDVIAYTLLADCYGRLDFPDSQLMTLERALLLDNDHIAITLRYHEAVDGGMRRCRRQNKEAGEERPAATQQSVSGRAEFRELFRIQSGVPMYSLAMCGDYLAVLRRDGTAQVFDSAGNSVRIMNLDLSVPEWQWNIGEWDSTGSENTSYTATGSMDGVVYQPCQSLLMLVRDESEEVISSSLSLEEMIGWFKWNLGFGNRFELFSLPSCHRICSGRILSHIRTFETDPNLKHLAFVMHAGPIAYLTIIDIEEQETVYEERVPMDFRWRLVIQGDSLYAAAGPIVHVYSLKGEEKPQKVYVACLPSDDVYDELTFREKKGGSCRITSLGDIPDAAIGPVGVRRNPTLVADYWSRRDCDTDRFWRHLSYDESSRLLILHKDDSLAVARLDDPAFRVYLLDNESDRRLSYRMIGVFGDKYAESSAPGELTVYRLELYDDK